uniref:Uncharacterized protein n=1 Tax=Nymphaea colorata TaxID=210225 RepID=A0A5K1C0L2_9MAGN
MKTKISDIMNPGTSKDQ